VSDLWILLPPGQRETHSAAAQLVGLKFSTYVRELGFVVSASPWERMSSLFRRSASAPFARDDVVLILENLPDSACSQLESLRDQLGLVLLQAGPRRIAITDREAWGQSRLSAGLAIPVALAARSMQTDGFEQRLQHLYSGWLRDGDVAIDVGAHVGRHAIPMAACVGRSGRVLAFEPNPGIFPVLQSRLSALGLANVSTLDAALSDSAGEADFVIAVDRIEESGLRERRYDSATRLEHVRVKLVRLDDIAPEAARFIKIDTEGAEFNVILGAGETLKRLRPLVSFEFGENSYGAYGVDPVAVHRYFAALDYVLVSIFGDWLDEKTFVRHSREQLYWDYVACPATDFAAVQSILRTYSSRG
jgi:FkbM family methyltransferase